ncbi:hypothetical protein DFH06DRAFT_1144960 [Mycena polygramma]|nr:hypothetical protein DFH06DRAFT_1144960 [Mycena polygramma]
MSFATTKASRRHSWHSPSAEPASLAAALARKQVRSASMPVVRPRPSVVPRKSALKRSPEGNLDSSSSVSKMHSLSPSADEKQTLFDHAKLPPSVKATHPSALKKISSRVLSIHLFVRPAPLIPNPTPCLPPPHERRLSSLLLYAKLPAPAEWDEVSVIFESESDSESDREKAEESSRLPPILAPRKVRFLVPAPPAPEPEYEEPAWSDFMIPRGLLFVGTGNVPDLIGAYVMGPITRKVANSIGHRIGQFFWELREEKLTIVAGTFLGELIQNAPQIYFGAKEQLPSSEWMADEMGV